MACSTTPRGGFASMHSIHQNCSESKYPPRAVNSRIELRSADFPVCGFTELSSPVFSPYLRRNLRRNLCRTLLLSPHKKIDKGCDKGFDKGLENWAATLHLRPPAIHGTLS